MTQPNQPPRATSQNQPSSFPTRIPVYAYANQRMGRSGMFLTVISAIAIVLLVWVGYGIQQSIAKQTTSCSIQPKK
jgi:cobalamin synthase